MITYLVILLTWAGVADPWTPASVQTALATTDAYYQAVSDQQQTVSAVVTPWLVSADPAPSSCDLNVYQSQALAAATAAGYDTTACDHFAFILPPAATPTCSWTGTGTLNGVNSPPMRLWARSNAASVLTHEVGYNLGIMHSYDLDCGNYVNGNNGTLWTVLKNLT